MIASRQPGGGGGEVGPDWPTVVACHQLPCFLVGAAGNLQAVSPPLAAALPDPLRRPCHLSDLLGDEAAADLVDRLAVAIGQRESVYCESMSRTGERWTLTISPAGEAVALVMVAGATRVASLIEGEFATADRLRDIVASSLDWLWEVDPAARYTACSDRVTDVLGYQPAELLGTSPFELMPAEERRKLEAPVAALFAARQPIVNLENWALTKSGRRRCFLTNAAPIFNAAGEFVGYRGADRDITALKHAEAALRESESRYRTLVENSPDIIMRFDRDGRHLYVSPNVTAVLGVPADALVGHTHREFGLDPVQCAFWEQAIEEVFTQGVCHESEFSFCSEQGEFVFNWRLTPEFDTAGEVVSVLSVSRDISEQRRASEALQASRAMFQTYFDHAPFGLLVVDPEGCFVQANPAACAMLGCRLDDLVGRHLTESLAPETVVDGLNHFERVRRHGTADGSFALLDRAGNRHWVLISAVALPDGNYLGMTVDVTAQRQAQSAVLALEQRLKTVIDNAPVVLWAVDRDGIFTMSEGRGLHALGLEPGEVVGRQVVEVYAGHDKILEMIERAQAGESVTTWVAVGDLVFEVCCQPTFGPSGEVIGVTGVSIDVTEQRKLQAKTEQSSKMEAVGRLAGGIAHDFNNLLTTIRGYCDFLGDQVDEQPAAAADLAEIRRAAERAAELTNQLLGFARSELPDRRPIAVNEVMVDTQRMLRRMISEDIEVVCELDPEVGSVMADVSGLTQVVMNLTVNARAAMGSGGTLTLQTRRERLTTARAERVGIAPGDYAVLAVRDTGCGMEQATLSRIFEPFFTTRSIGEGTGLGLATVYAIVTRLDGGIQVESSLGRGTCFEVYLPAAPDLAKGGEALPAAPRAAAREPVQVLLVEDEPTLRRLAERLIADAGHRVVTAGSIAEARQLAGQPDTCPDVLVTDIVMPGGHGTELAAELRAQRPDLPVVYVTGYSLELLDAAVLSHPRCVLVQKPFTAGSLLGAMDQVLDQQRQFV